MESFHAKKFSEFGISTQFLQDNHSKSIKNTVRGLHFQSSPGQEKLIRCTLGAIWDVVVDIRQNSSTLGKWFAVELNETNQHIFYVPLGFAHGFLVTSKFAEVQYKCSNVYNSKTETGIAWNDPELNIEWPIRSEEALLSQRDKTNQSWRDYLKAPVF